MKLLSPSQARELDHKSMGELGISGAELMGNAGNCIAKKAMKMVSKIHNPIIFILCGKGNNGGDGFAAAITLSQKKYKVIIQSTSDKAEIKGDSLNYYLKCVDENIFIIHSDETPEIETPDLLIDSLFGTGLNGEVWLKFQSLIQWVNQLDTMVLAVDIPSGLDGNSGLPNPVAVKATTTVSFGGLKLGSVFRQGANCSGEACVSDIGFPAIQLSGLNWKTVKESFIKKTLLKPALDTHKYSSGKVIIIAGSMGMTGAAILATYGALRSGAGVTITTSPSSINEILEKSILEGMTLILKSEEGIITPDHEKAILEKAKWADAVVLGPGLGRDPKTQVFIKNCVKYIESPVVLDADGLFPFENNLDSLNDRRFPLVITPHLGELSHISSIGKETIIREFPDVMTEIMNQFSHVALVKQVPTCTFSSKNAFVNSSGNPGLATAGSGDVLSGMIASFIAQGNSLETASILGAYIHGRASDNLITHKGYRGQVASDLLGEIPAVIAQYETT